MGVSGAPLNAMLTTEEAADYLGISRPTWSASSIAATYRWRWPTGHHRHQQEVSLGPTTSSVTQRLEGRWIECTHVPTGHCHPTAPPWHVALEMILNERTIR